MGFKDIYLKAKRSCGYLKKMSGKYYLFDNSVNKPIELSNCHHFSYTWNEEGRRTLQSTPFPWLDAINGKPIQNCFFM